MDTLTNVSGLSSMSLSGKAAYHEIKRFIKLVKIMAQDNFDIRRLNYLRLALTKENSDTDFIPLAAYVRACQRILNVSQDFERSETFTLMKELLAPSIEQVKERFGAAADYNSNYEDGFVSLSRFNLLVELYHYFPIMRTKDKNISTELYYIMSSNKRGQAESNNSNTAAITTKTSNNHLVSESSRSQFFNEKDENGRLKGASKTVIGGFGAAGTQSIFTV